MALAGIRKNMSHSLVGQCWMSRLFVFYLVFAGSWTTTFGSYCEEANLDVNSHRGIRIEPLAKSRVQVVLNRTTVPPRRANKFMVNLRFKTNGLSGIIFYARPADRSLGYMFGFYLRNGRLMYSLRCPGIIANLRIRGLNYLRLNNGVWHTLNYKISSSRMGSIILDGHELSRSYIVTCDQMKYVSIGGFNPRDHGLLADFENQKGLFNGCIGSTYIPASYGGTKKYYSVSMCL